MNVQKNELMFEWTYEWMDFRWKRRLWFQDAWTDKDGYLYIDSQQDFKLKEAAITDHVTTLTFSRKFDTCDDNDYVLDVSRFVLYCVRNLCCVWCLVWSWSTFVCRFNHIRNDSYQNHSDNDSAFFYWELHGDCFAFFYMLYLFIYLFIFFIYSFLIWALNSWIVPWGTNKVFWLDLTWLDILSFCFVIACCEHSIV